MEFIEYRIYGTLIHLQGLDTLSLRRQGHSYAWLEFLALTK